MKQINDYITEKFLINKNTKIDNNYYDDAIYKMRKNNGELFQWAQWWEYLMENGPHSKYDLLTHFNLVPTSYANQFALLARRNIIVPNKKTKKLEAQPIEKWVESK